MSVQSQIDRINQNVANTYAVLEGYGATMPTERNSDNLSATAATVIAAKIEPADDDIPKVFFGAALPQTKNDTIMSFRYISKTQDISGYCKTKAQGSSSISYPKKNQTVKLYADAECTEKLKVNFKDWGEQNKFCFKANWIDLTHARNIATARLWGDVVKSRADYADIPELLRTSPNQGAIDGFPVKVYAGGVYQGRYTINIPKDAWMASMNDSLDTHCILCGESNADDRSLFRATASIDGSDWSDEVHDSVPNAIKIRWNEAIAFIVNSTDEEFVSGIGNYFDVENLIDYYLFGLASCGLDAFGKNQLYMTYDGQKWIATMYDMDSTWGLWWNGSSFVATDYDRSEYQDFKDGEGNLLYIRLENLFYEELKARWAELRIGALSIENIINRFERFTDIAPAELVAEDYASTTADGKFTGIPSKTTSTIQQIRSYAVARHAWCDTYVAGLAGGGEVEPDVPDVPDIPDEPDAPNTDEFTIELSKNGLWKENGFNTSETDWMSSEIMPLPVGFAYDTITSVDTSITAIIDVFDSEQTFIEEFAGKPASCVLPNAQYYAVAKYSTSDTSFDVKFTETYPGAIKCLATNVGLWKENGLDPNTGNWRTSDKFEIPSSVTTGTIKIANHASHHKIIDTFDADGNFIKEHAGVSEIAFDSTVRYFAVALIETKTNIPTIQRDNRAIYVYVE